MTTLENVVNSYVMHPLISDAYINVHNIFDQDPNRKDYRNLSNNDSQKALHRDNLLYAAFNFNYYFPTHYFKACHSLQSDKVIGTKKISAWLRYNPYLTVIDVGCGDGAGSIALIDTVLRLRENKEIDSRPIQLFFVGIDPNLHGLQIYEEMMSEIKILLLKEDIWVDYTTCPYLVSQASNIVDQQLFDIKTKLCQPSLSHVVAIASNIADLLHKEYEYQQKKFTGLKSYKPENFGQHLSTFYRQLLEGTPIDHLHVITIDTEPDKIYNAIREMLYATRERFNAKEHLVEDESIQLEKIAFINPPKSFWREKHNRTAYEIDAYVVSICHIHNRDLNNDSRWQNITSKENLELAWARARHQMLRESLSDEIEILLFEQTLELNLERLSFELQSYAVHNDYLSQTLKYTFPKNEISHRPRGLTWLEAEILTIAVIQVVGANWLQHNPQSFAYRLSPENSLERGATEYLYEGWKNSWLSYRREIEICIQRYPYSNIVKTDIKSYFTQIIQDRLQDIIRDRLNIGSRIEWIVKLIINKEIPNHEPGRGLVQGSIGSGFWANLYLASIDSLFPVNDSKNRKLFRYVDDIVVVVPDPIDAEFTKVLIESTLKSVLDLEISLDKTGIIPASTFLSSISPDEKIEQLQDCYEKLTQPLWQLNLNLISKFRKNLENNRNWWSIIHLYQSCLTELGLYVSDAWVSRQIHRTINGPNLAQNSIITLNFPDLPDTDSLIDFMRWADAFRSENPDWEFQLSVLKSDLIQVFRESYDIIFKRGTLSEGPAEGIQRRLRFTVNRLGFLGLESIHVQLLEILCKKPWTFRDIKLILEVLAKHAYSSDIWRLIDHYDQGYLRENSTYMVAVAVRSIRFFPRMELEDWRKLLDFLFVDDEIIKLMATETWLFITSKFKSSQIPFQLELQEKLCQTLQADCIPNRHLLKNYLLILGSVDRGELKRISGNYVSDPICSSACIIASNGFLANLFTSNEPEILRSKYYSTKNRPIEDGSEEPIS